jgi:hypothetical protein
VALTRFALLAAVVFIGVRFVVLCRDIAADKRNRVGGSPGQHRR